MQTKYIMFENDIITIMYNEILKNKPYLIRLNNYDNEQYEIRMSKEEIDDFLKFIYTFKGA